jgi:hypothetical protein
LQARGIDPYFTFNAADVDFLNQLQPDDIPTLFAKVVFKGKEALAGVGLIPTGTLIVQYAKSPQVPDDPLVTFGNSIRIWKTIATR